MNFERRGRFSRLRNEWETHDACHAESYPTSAKMRENAQMLRRPAGPAPGQRRAPRSRCATLARGIDSLEVGSPTLSVSRATLVFEPDRSDLSTTSDAIHVAARRVPVARGLVLRYRRAQGSAVRGGGRMGQS